MPRIEYNNIEVLQLANALTRKWSLSHQVNRCLQDLDRMITQRTLELQTAKGELQKAGRKPALGRETILVVDDEPDLRELVTQVLESEGYQVFSAGSGAEALEQWNKRRGEMHLLLTDIVMPDGLTGRKLADRLQREDPRLRVIFTSGHTAGQPGTELANVEERNFLPKPYRPATLLQIVRDCLDQPCASANASEQAA
jgi:CheY-like chemotaxis protein